jgi:hypothetical protein
MYVIHPLVRNYALYYSRNVIYHKLRSAQSNYVITDLSFVFPANSIWLLPCNAMNFDNLSLDTGHLFQNVVLPF